MAPSTTEYRATRSARASHAPRAPRLRLFCFHHAGGSASLYRGWSAHVTPGTEIVPVLLPGRGARRAERAFTRMAPIVDDVLRSLSRQLDGPFAFFGHSMGALVAFAATQALRRAGSVGPKHLFVSACAPPHRQKDSARRMRELSDTVLARLVRDLGGPGEHGLDDDEMILRNIPLLRADLEVCETYEADDGAPLPCPVTAYGAFDDPIASPEYLDEWREYAAASFLRRLFPGNHFFLVARSRPATMRVLNRELGLLIGREDGP